MENVKKVLRWVAVLPGAILALVLSYALIKLFMSLSNWFIGVSADSPYMKIAEIFISGVSGYYFVYIGSKIAPTNQKGTAYVLTGIIFLLSGAIIFNDLQMGEYYNAIAIASTAIGAMTFLYLFNSGEVKPDDSIFE